MRFPVAIRLTCAEEDTTCHADQKDDYANVEGFEEETKDISPTDYQWKESFEVNIKDSFEDEIADTLIRLLDLVGCLKIDIDLHVAAKREYNRLRPYKHGKKY